MDVVNYKAIQDMNPWNYTEHQISSSLSSTSALTDILNITGKGFFESLYLMYYNSTNGPVPQLVVKKDAETILNVTHGYRICICPNSSLHYTYNSANLCIYMSDIKALSAADHLLWQASWNGGFATLNFPSDSEQSGDYVNIVTLDHPIFFNQSLEIQVNVPSPLFANYTIKARY